MTRTERFGRLLRLRTHSRRQEELAFAQAMRLRLRAEQDARQCEVKVQAAEQTIDHVSELRAGEWLELRAVLEGELQKLRLARIGERRQQRIAALRLQELRQAMRRERQMEELLRLASDRAQRDDVRREQAMLDDLRPQREGRVEAW